MMKIRHTSPLQKYVTIKVRLPIELHKKLEKEANSKKITVADILLECVKKYLAKN